MTKTTKVSQSETIENEKPVKKPITKKAEEKNTIDSSAIEQSQESKIAKAGKRSTKSIKEAEEKAAKEERKTQRVQSNSTQTEKKIIKVARPKSERRGKNYKTSYNQIDRTKEYQVLEAAELASKTSTTKFDSTVELHIRLGVDPKQADQNVRGSLTLPHGTGKTLRIAVFANSEHLEQAKKAGADIAEGDEFLQRLDKNLLDFDILIATPSVMPKLGKYAKILGPKGLMPNPKSGTVTDEIAKAVKESKAGKIEYRVDSYGIVHAVVGKASFEPKKLEENIVALIDNIKSMKPSSLKGHYIISAYVTSSMGPSIKLSVKDL